MDFTIHLIAATFLMIVYNENIYSDGFLNINDWFKIVTTRRTTAILRNATSTAAVLRFWEPNTSTSTDARRRANVGRLVKRESNFMTKMIHEETKTPTTNSIHGPKVALAQATATAGTSTKLEAKINMPAESLKDSNSNFVLSPYQLLSQYKLLLADFPDTNVTSEVLGRTASYIDLVVFKISKLETKSNIFLRAQDKEKYAEEIQEKKIVFIVHALSSMGLSSLYSLTLEKYLRKLISFYLAHLDKFDIYLMPMANPDGFIQGRKMPWNKNVSPQGACMGVALDRNFDVAWNISRNVSSCSQHYPGKMPFSEPETAAVRDIFHLFSHKIIAYFHVHAGTYNMHTFKGDAVLYPRGFTEHQSDDDKYIDLRADIEEAMANANFKVISVTVDTLQSWYGKVAGTSVDYAATVYGIPFAMELVMQVYQDPSSLSSYGVPSEKEEIEYYALTEIWQRVIDVIFNNIYKKDNTNEVRLRRTGE